MRRLLTSALSCVLAAALIGPVNASTNEGALSSPDVLAGASTASLDPAAAVPQDAVDAAVSGLNNDIQNAAPASAAAPVKPASVTVASANVDGGGPDGGTVNQSAGPASPLSDLLMWSAPTVAPAAGSTASLSAHASHTIQRFTAGILDRTRGLVAKITESAMQFIGTPYSFGGTTAAGFDCSGYVQRVFAMVGITLPRTADEQYLVGQHINASQAKRGDLVFFQTYTAGVSHVGIYLGNDEFIHSSSSRGVTVSSMHDTYWASHLVGVERIVHGDRVGYGETPAHV